MNYKGTVGERLLQILQERQDLDRRQKRQDMAEAVLYILACVLLGIMVVFLVLTFISLFTFPSSNG